MNIQVYDDKFFLGRAAGHRLLEDEGQPAEVIRSVGIALPRAPIEVAFVGIGENGLAFTDPAADL